MGVAIPERMRAVVQHGPQDLRLEERAVRPPGPGEVLVRVRAAGICGSDLHFWKHAVYGSDVVLGHEIAGEVAVVGEGVAGLAPGALGAVHGGFPCGRCERCRAGLGYYCHDGGALGTGGGDGGFAEYVTAPATCFLPAPPDTDPGALTFTEPLSNGLRCLDHPEVREARTALVIGGGPIGLACLAAAKSAGVERVVLVEGRKRRREAAGALGAELVLHPEQEDLRETLRRELGEGPDLVVEAVGHPETIQSAFRAARPGGTVFLMGVCFGAVPFEPLRWMLKELTIRSSLGGDARDHAKAVAMLATGEIDLRPLVTRRIPLEALPEAIAELAGGADEIKVVVEHAGAS
jgi:threonine dehydrogenase-like Zn-dependent dehydrogenase